MRFNLEWGFQVTAPEFNLPFKDLLLVLLKHFKENVPCIDPFILVHLVIQLTCAPSISPPSIHCIEDDKVLCRSCQISCGKDKCRAKRLLCGVYELNFVTESQHPHPDRNHGRILPTQCSSAYKTLTFLLTGSFSGLLAGGWAQWYPWIWLARVL